MTGLVAGLTWQYLKNTLDRLPVTPTCVGKTGFGSKFSDPSTVHPHMRGEDLTAGLARAVITGSPPHAWGRHPNVNPVLLGKRFTPTCVGKTNKEGICLECHTVHPHMRGEDMRSSCGIASLYGSPPHAWGRRAPESVRRRWRRFTPTCVGKTG